MPHLPARTHKVGMRLALGADAARAWDGLDRKVRNQVRKAEKSGLTWRRGGVELLDRFYAVFAQNMRDLGTPVYSRRFFEHVLSTFPATSSVCLVDHGDRTVAGAITLSHRDILEVPWASSLREYRSQCPNNLLYWRIIEHAIESGRRSLDFGRSTPNEGTYHFKEQWGARPEPLYWEYVMRGRADSAGPEPRESQISRRDRGVDAAAARDHELHRSAHRQVDPVMSSEASPRTAECDVRSVRERFVPDGACDAAIRIAYAAAAAGFVAYAVWGTLFPFDFHAVPLETAARLFWSRGRPTPVVVVDRPGVERSALSADRPVHVGRARAELARVSGSDPNCGSARRCPDSRWRRRSR